MLTDIVQVELLHIFHPNPCTSEQCVLDLEVTDMDPPPTIRARVVWYDHAAEGSPFTFHVGVEFIDTTADQKEELRACIQRLKTHRC